MDSSLLHRYRRDRRNLLQFLISSSAPAAAQLAAADFDAISADYVLSRLRSGGDVDIAEAKQQYLLESDYPTMMQSQLKSSFFLVTDPEFSGSPPRRLPPQPNAVHDADHVSYPVPNSESREEDGLTYQEAPFAPLNPLEIRDGEVPSLGLPCLQTGLSDDDLQGSAYEILLASMIFNGMNLLEPEKKKDKGSKILTAMKSKKNKMHVEPHPRERHLELLNILRTQMQISEATDSYIKRRLTLLAESRNGGRIDVPQICLGLVHVIQESDFSTEKYYFQWKNRQLNMLEEIISSSPDLTDNDHHIARTSLARARDSKDCNSKMPSSQSGEVLSAVWQVASKLSSLPGKFGLESESFYWTAAYHLNIRLYEKLIMGIFDILDEAHLIEEAQEILRLVRITWSTLGITEKLHEVIYCWVCFQQFLATEEPFLLDYVVLELERALNAEGGSQKEDSYINALMCSWKCNEHEEGLDLLQAVFHSIGIWCDSKLQDYHQHFRKEPTNFKRVMTLLSMTGVPILDDNGRIKLIKLSASEENATRKVKSYVENSIEATCCRVLGSVDLESKLEKMHPLALLATELHLVAKREFSTFYPEFRNWSPDVGIISARKLKKFYGERLGPYLENLSCVSEDARSVLSAANKFDRGLTHLYQSACKEDGVLIQKLDHYKIEDVAGPIILDWVIAQQTRILQWIERASNIEEWEAVSSQQRQATSAVEVFRIIEETLDQFFGWNLQMNITHLQALLSVIFHSLDVYLSKVSERLVDKKHLLPSAPPLTRYTEMNIPIMRRKMTEFTLDDNTVNEKIASSTISKLCIRLNTLEYIKKQTSTLEESLRKTWAELKSSEELSLGKDELQESSSEAFLTYDETVDELFVSTFSCIKESCTDAIGKICDLIGSRMVFWDLRDTFLLCLYRDSVEDARLDKFITPFDTVLNYICGVLDDSLRDLVALSICRASLDGFVWVLLDGGPSRAFSDSDVPLMEEDLNTLKEFFIAEGLGLPRSVLDKESKVAEHILHLYSFQVDVLIQMLLNASGLIESGIDSQKRSNVPEDAQILIRILCHKRDREASKFLKKQYQLPMASEYDDTPSKESPVSSSISDIFKRSASVNWTEKGQKSLHSFRKRIQEATSDIRPLSGW